MKWVQYVQNDDDSWSYGRVNDEGRVLEVALPFHQPLIDYLAWVEAGNNPDDFWSQSEDFLSEGSQPNEEEI